MLMILLFFFFLTIEFHFCLGSEMGQRGMFQFFIVSVFAIVCSVKFVLYLTCRTVLLTEPRLCVFQAFSRWVD